MEKRKQKKDQTCEKHTHCRRRLPRPKMKENGRNHKYEQRYDTNRSILPEQLLAADQKTKVVYTREESETACTLFHYP